VKVQHEHKLLLTKVQHEHKLLLTTGKTADAAVKLNLMGYGYICGTTLIIAY